MKIIDQYTLLNDFELFTNEEEDNNDNILNQ